MIRRWFWCLGGFLLVLGLSACERPLEKTDGARFESVRFTDLPGWYRDDHGRALSALRRSCPRLRIEGTGRHGTAADWKPICDRLQTGKVADARRFFEQNFSPVRVTTASGMGEGLITGYYEPELRGARHKIPPYSVPLYRRPPELVSVDLGRFREEFAGRRIAGHVVDGSLLPYFDRRDFDEGVLDGRGLELVWVDSAVDAFFLHIQGSGRVRLRDGTVMRLGYDGFNGHSYRAIGRDLIHRGEISREHMSMQAIRRWLDDNPGSAAELMWGNRSYVFFRVLRGDGPIGTGGVALTPGRSIAVDRHLVPLGLPVWIDTRFPDERNTPLQRLAIAQDTGGAIKGAVRADLFWGAGSYAEMMAGRMKSPLRLWILQPARRNSPGSS